MIIQLPITCRNIGYIIEVTLLSLFIFGVVAYDEDHYACRGTIGDMNCGFTSLYGGFVESSKVLGFMFGIVLGLIILNDWHKRGKWSLDIKCKCDKK